jgi:hypothetical protein
VKKLDIEDSCGMPSESIKAWLPTVRQVVQWQAVLGGDSWSSIVTYYGVTAHLKGNANKLLVVINEGMAGEAYTFEYRTIQFRQKDGRRENEWNIQKRSHQRSQQPGERLDSEINSLTNIGFGKRMSM